MTTREELKALIDQLPESQLQMVQTMLNHQINPAPPNLDIERMQKRSRNYRTMVEQRFRETGKPGTIRSMGGSGFSGMHESTPFGRHGFHYWDVKALVHQSLQSFDGEKIEVMERLSFSQDRATLICALELSSSGKTVRHEDAFPLHRSL
ncbi:MAG TPA: hypothetical protein VHS80_14165 [Chthoniobacterales bacterium]|nr:hypothetical protein [Chthoniobacterales bacterium]